MDLAIKNDLNTFKWCYLGNELLSSEMLSNEPACFVEYVGRRALRSLKRDAHNSSTFSLLHLAYGKVQSRPNTMQLTPWSNVRSIAVAGWGKPRLASLYGFWPVATQCSGASE